MTTAPLRIPRFEAAEARISAWFGAPVFRVTSEGAAAELHFEPGDLLLVDHGGVSAGDLVMLVPQRHGRPMLGRMTKDGLVSEPGKVPVALNGRWHVAGRVTLRVRRNPRASAQVLPFNDAQPQAQLLFQDPSRIADGPHIHLGFERALGDLEIQRLRQRLRGFRMTGRDEARIAPADLFENAPLDVLGSLVAELRQTLGIAVKAVRAESRDTAQAVLGRLPFDSVAVVRPGARYARPVRAPKAAPELSEARRQLGLFS
ncbi:MAG: hypothetical protein GY913_21965 [Proteobacteria bacterium]|nr:hypothetical protein [Pseudomonadota bacterium]MCP4919578.1 hypothetical protein [Pseudomonadota bacterium]